MEIYWLRQFWFGEAFHDDTSLHKHYFTITFANKPNIDAQIWLTIFSSGAKWSGGAITDLGIAAAGIKSFKFINSSDKTETKEFDSWESHVRIEKCVELTVAFHVKLAWAKAEGNIYYWK
jgi:hypothetical protein